MSVELSVFALARRAVGVGVCARASVLGRARAHESRSVSVSESEGLVERGPTGRLTVGPVQRVERVGVCLP